MLESLGVLLQGFISDIGYLGIFILMVLESTFVPVPSVLVMPFAGFLATEAGGAHFSLPMVILMNVLGALVGSWAFYYFGAKGGKPILIKYGKWLLVKPEDIQRAEDFFNRKGKLTVFVARFLPVVRHFISFVAGIGKMPLLPFTWQTGLGAGLWGGFLAVMGFVLGDNWEVFSQTWKKFDTFIGLGFILAALIFYLRWRSKRKKANKAPAAEPG